MLGGAVDGPSEPGPYCHYAADDGLDEVLPGPGGHDGVVCAGNGRTVVGDYLENQFDEIPCVFREVPLEPKEPDNTAYPVSLLDNLVDGQSAVSVLVSPLVADGGDE